MKITLIQSAAQIEIKSNEIISEYFIVCPAWRLQKKAAPRGVL